jgi:hypothetical protein
LHEYAKTVEEEGVEEEGVEEEGVEEEGVEEEGVEAEGMDTMSWAESRRWARTGGLKRIRLMCGRTAGTAGRLLKAWATGVGCVDEGFVCKPDSKCNRMCTCIMRLVSQLLTLWFTSALLRMSSRTTSLKPLHGQFIGYCLHERRRKRRRAHLFAAIVNGGKMDVVKLTSQPSSTSFCTCSGVKSKTTADHEKRFNCEYIIQRKVSLP